MRFLGAHRTTLAIIALALSAGAAFAGPRDWANWRGPEFNGSSAEVGLPVKFSPTEGVKWAVDLPGPSAATPAIWGDSVFVSSTEPAKQLLLALCLDRKTGKIRWQKVAGSGYQPGGGQGNPLQIDGRSNYASPSPVTDGKRVVFFYGNGDMVAYDFGGKELWRKNIQQECGDFAFNWTFGSSPQLYDGKLYLQILQRNIPVQGRGKDGSESYLMAMDPATGKELWRAVRPTDARMESREAYSTPIPFVHNGRKEIVISGGDIVSGHDAATGKELWRWGTWNTDHLGTSLRLVPSPVTGAGIILASAPKQLPVFAIKAGGSGDLGPAGIAWQSPDRSALTSDVPTPLFYKNRFYVLSDLKKAISCVEPATGKVLWSSPTPGFSPCWGSPTGADGKVYVISLKGEVHVYNADTGELLATNPMADQENEIRSSVAVAYGNLFVRTNSKLYCIGK